MVLEMSQQHYNAGGARLPARSFSLGAPLALALGLAFYGAAAQGAAAEDSAARWAPLHAEDAAAPPADAVSQGLAHWVKSAAEGNPTVSLSDEQDRLQLSKSALDFQRQTEDAALSVSVGFGPKPAITAAGSLLLRPGLAVGTRLHAESLLSDATVNVVGEVSEANLRLQGAVNFMRGRQDFLFYRSTESARLSQMGYFGSASWVNPSASPLGLQSAGVVIWGAKAKNHSQFDVLNYVDQTPDTWVLTRDRRLISAGTLLGGAVELQYAVSEQLVLEGAFGSERLRFPFSDGSEESTRKPYADLKLNYALDARNQFSLGGKTGAAETRVEAEWKRPTFAISAFKVRGQEANAGRWGVGVTFDVLAWLNRKTPRGGVSLAASLRPRVTQHSDELLKRAMERPTPLPSTFLAKVDPTGVERHIVDKAGQ